MRFGDVVSVNGNALAVFDGQHVDHLSLLACTPQSCHPIPFQIDERDGAGQWVLDQGPEPTSDTSAGVLDAKDVLLFLAADAGERADRTQLRSRSPAAEIMLRDPLSNWTAWVYLIASADTAPRAPTGYVHYDPEHDRVRGRRVSLGFRQGIPDYLGIRDDDAGEVNLLDRLKVRATATFLWGLIRFARSEDDLTNQFVAWKEGPIRIIRRQRQWVRIGWGIRSPMFGSYTFFYPDSAELPVALRLNFPPRYFFGDIQVRTILDFRELRGWSVFTPSLPAPLPIDGTMTPSKRALNRSTDSWFALVGPRLTLVQTMDVSPSLATVRRRILYREGLDISEPPEAVPGEEPGIGFQLDRWDHVGAGAHQLSSMSYAVPAQIDIGDFMRSRAAPIEGTVHVLP